jgi:hypothetical protein
VVADLGQEALCVVNPNGLAARGADLPADAQLDQPGLGVHRDHELRRGRRGYRDGSPDRQLRAGTPCDDGRRAPGNPQRTPERGVGADQPALISSVVPAGVRTTPLA